MADEEAAELGPWLTQNNILNKNAPFEFIVEDKNTKAKFVLVAKPAEQTDLIRVTKGWHGQDGPKCPHCNGRGIL